MAFVEDDAPKPRPSGHQVGEDLSALSVDELNNRIELLEDEIKRLRAAVEAKQATRSAADDFFKK